MHLSPRVVWLIACTLLHGAPPLAAQTPVHVTRYTVDDGLAQNHITGIVQDRTGFIWVGTSRGLQRFDGHSFVRIGSIDPAAPAALEEAIVGLRLDPRGRIWVSTLEGLYFARGGTTGFQRVRGAVVAAPDSAGRLWLLSDGVLQWTEWAAAEVQLRPTPVRLVAECCSAVATTRRGDDIWLALNRSSNAIVRISLRGGEQHEYDSQGIGTVMAVAEDAASRIWIAGTGGVAVLDPGGAAFRPIPRFDNLDVRLLIPRGETMLVPASWGLVHIDASGAVLDELSAPDGFLEGTLGPASLLTDREGGVWVGTTASGLVRLGDSGSGFVHAARNSRLPLPVNSDFVMALHPSADGSVWAGTLGGGAYRLDADWRVLQSLQVADATLPHNEVWDMESARDGSVWFATTLGLCRAPSKAGPCVPPPEPLAPATALALDGEGWFWVARGSAGIASFDPGAGRAGTILKTSEGPISIYVDARRGELWFAGDSVFRARIGGGRLLEPPENMRLGVSGGGVFEVRRDGRGRLWVGSREGLYRFDDDTRSFTRITTPELERTTVFSIAEDARGDLWLGTAHGIVHYEPGSGRSRRYTRRHGVYIGEPSRHAAARLDDGVMLFGGLHGITRFDPAAVTAPRAPPPLAITRVRRIRSDGIHDFALTPATQLAVSRRDLAVTIEFAALTFDASAEPRFRYRLEGLQHDWIESTDRSVTYAAPPPGNYTFEVQASDGADGAWTEAAVSLPLRVVPPFWRTAWFRLLLVGVFAGTAWALHRVRLRQVIATERLRLRIARDLHDEIGAGLSSIALMSDAVGSDGVSRAARAQVERIGRSAREMVEDLRDIVWAIDPDGDRLDDVVMRMRDVSADLLRGVHVDFTAPSAAELSGKIGMAARRDLLRFYKEVLHNVARHARASAVDIRLAAAGEFIELTVADDGSGFDPRAVRGGTGLKSMYERAARLGGRLEMSRRDAGGTIVRLTLRRT